MNELEPISKPNWKETMSDTRQTAIELNQNLSPDEQEMDNGWHFCWEFDGLLVNAFDPEMRKCGCRCMDEYFAHKGQRIVDEL